MSTTAKVGIMADPNDVGTIAGVLGLGSMGSMFLVKMWRDFLASRAGAANSQAEIQMLRELQTENKDLRARNDAKDLQIASLMQEKFTYQADLRTALSKIQSLSEQIDDLKGELTAIKNAVRGSA